jgi:hypothetical protein
VTSSFASIVTLCSVTMSWAGANGPVANRAVVNRTADSEVFFIVSIWWRAGSAV